MFSNLSVSDIKETIESNLSDPDDEEKAISKNMDNRTKPIIAFDYIESRIDN